MHQLGAVDEPAAATACGASRQLLSGCGSLLEHYGPGSLRDVMLQCACKLVLVTAEGATIVVPQLLGVEESSASR